MLDDPIETFFPRREFQKLHYSSDIVEKLTQEKDSFEIIFPFPQYFLNKITLLIFFPNGFQLFFKCIYLNSVFFNNFEIQDFNIKYAVLVEIEIRCL